MDKIAYRTEIVDGIWPDIGAYAQCIIPPEWLTPEAWSCLGGDVNMVYVDLVEAIESRLKDGVCELSKPSKETAQRTVSALNRYAEYLQREFID